MYKVKKKENKSNKFKSKRTEFGTSKNVPKQNKNSKKIPLSKIEDFFEEIY